MDPEESAAAPNQGEEAAGPAPAEEETAPPVQEVPAGEGSPGSGGETAARAHHEEKEELAREVMELSLQNEYLKSQIADARPAGGADDGSELVRALKEQVEKLTREVQEQRLTREATERALEHVNVAYAEADGKVQGLTAKLAQAEQKMEKELKERDDKYVELDTKFQRLHKRAKQRIQDIQKEKDDLEARFNEVNQKAEQAASLQLAAQQELERARQQASEALRSMDAERQQLRAVNSKLRANLDETRLTLEARNNSLEKLQQSVLEKEQLLEKVQGSLQSAEDKRMAIISELTAKHQKQLESLQAQLAEISAERTKASPPPPPPPPPPPRPSPRWRPFLPPARRAGRQAMEVGIRSLGKAIDDADHSNSTVEGIDRNESAAMRYIRGYYKQALSRLPPSLTRRVLKAGFCFGFLDPISNIITNTAAYEDSSSPAEEANRAEQGRRGNKRKRSQVRTDKGKETGEIAARSLRGLVAFLISYFRYLTTREALRYLCLAKADLLVALHLVEKDRDTCAFTIHLMTTKVALTCAILSAMSSEDLSGPAPSAHHPKVIDFVHRSLTLGSRLDEVFSLLHPMQGHLSISTLMRLTKLSKHGMHVTADPREPMRHAISKFQDVSSFLSFPPHANNVSVPYDLELALTGVLLDKIHGFYLKAISSFPAPCLQLRHHRSLLKAGHCYGLFDPVSNIILNTIWYDTMFPPDHEFKVSMICDESLASTECRSLHGLITFIEKLFPAFSAYDAMRYLLLDNGSLEKVIMRATQEGYRPAIPLQAAYKAAARVAHHPDPDALANLATVLLPREERKLKSLLKAKRILSPDDIQTISATLSQNDATSKSLVVIQELTSSAKMIVSAKRKEFEALQSSVCNRVHAALKKHAHDTGVEYELLAICGVNTQIPEPGSSSYFADCDGYPYSHANIWATQKGWLADAAPTLLFIQCSNDSEDNGVIPLCLPVSESSKDAGRCFHCECQGAKIVHPSSGTYLGQGSDFKHMARGEHTVSNEELIGLWGQKTVFLDTSEDYCIYFDPAWDADFAMRLNRDAKRVEEYGEEFTPAEVNKISEILKLMVASVG